MQETNRRPGTRLRLEQIGTTSSSRDPDAPLDYKRGLMGSLTPERPPTS